MKVRIPVSPFATVTAFRIFPDFGNCIYVAIRAIHDMVKAPDFDRKMLLLATQISHKSEMKTVLLTALECLLKAVVDVDVTRKNGGWCPSSNNASGNANNPGDVVVESMTLIRCIIKLALNLLNEPTANR